MPLAHQRYPPGVTRSFLDGLLPEGESRSASANVGVYRDDTFGLIRALGRDCAGALVIQPSDDPAPAGRGCFGPSPSTPPDWITSSPTLGVPPLA
jgi:serine/threonine-protein kinase HipA